jgi:DNA-binding NarL/FixJ family response regulator
MLQRLAALVPHLQRAVTIGRLFEQGKTAQRASDILAATLDHVETAVFLVCADGTVTFSNGPAKKLLDESVVVHAREGALHAVSIDANQVLHEAFVSAASGGASLPGVAVPLTEESEEQWFAYVLPLTSGRRQQSGDANDAVAAIFVRRAAPNAPLPLEVIAKRYGLLPSEVRVLGAITQMHGVKELASHLGLSENTIKSHLQNLFRKIGAKRQIDLIRLVSGL